jgi:Iron/manganese superoxide dismutases, C-terminal domain
MRPPLPCCPDGCETCAPMGHAQRTHCLSTKDFGSFELFKRQLTEVAATIMGSRWGAWEHAYALQYKNEKKVFFETVWHLWNWKDIAARFARDRVTAPERATALPRCGCGEPQYAIRAPFA